MNPRKIILLLSIVLSILILQAQNKPNILFIAIDDCNDYVGCMNGALKAFTPNIDKLAGQGVLFTNAHCQAPICGPSRACIMTGMLPSTTGNYLQLNDKDIKKGNEKVAEAIFMPDYFEQFGYKTMGVGKIYHGRDGAKTFDEYAGGWEWFGPKPKERFKYDPAKLPHKTGGTQTDWGAFPAHDSLMPDYKSARWVVDKLNQNHEKPFFLAVGMLRPHVPWYTPQKWMDMYPIEKIKLPPYKKDDYNDIPEMSIRVNEAPCMPTTEELIEWGEWENMIQAYLACITFADAQIGKILDALEHSKYAKNTIVVLWSDHGYHLGEKNRVAKQAIWERSTRVPLIFRDIGHKNSGAKCNAPVQLADIYPTLVEMCGLPENNLTEGHSLKNLIKDPDSKWNYPCLSFYGVGNVAVRDEQFRLMQYEDGSLELYDMINDPNEWNNLADKKEYKKVIKILQKNIPDTWSPLSKFSKYDFNEYFIEKSK